ncbi:MAG: CBS domain-containing protein [Acidobacteriota bacterium]
MRTVRELIEGRKLYTVTEDTSILEVVRIMTKRKFGAMPITDASGRVIGIFTERDLMKRVVAAELDTKNTPVSKVMTRKLFTASLDESPMNCLRKMKERKFRHLLIAKGGKVVGIVSQRDLIEVELTTKTKALLSIDA